MRTVARVYIMTLGICAPTSHEAWQWRPAQVAGDRPRQENLCPSQMRDSASLLNRCGSCGYAAERVSPRNPNKTSCLAFECAASNDSASRPPTYWLARQAS